MSSNIYTLKFAIDDSKIREIEKRILNITSGGQASGLSGVVTGASKGGNTGNMMKNITKIGVIATGVIGILSLVKKVAEMSVAASPMLQQMLKLFNFGIMLILRPIGDFFGFFLRPIVLYFLRNIALPWFRFARPLMQKLGIWLGNEFAKNPVGALLSITPIGSIISNWDEITHNLEGHWLTLEQDLGKWVDGLELPSYDTLVTNLTTWIDSLNLPTFDSITVGITDWIDEQLPKLPLFGDFIFNGVANWIINGLNGLPEWWNDLMEGFTLWLDNMEFPDWTDVISVFTDIKNSLVGVGNIIGDIIDAILEVLGLKNNNDKSSNNGGNGNNKSPQGLELPDLGQIQNQVTNWFEDFQDRITGGT